MFGRNKPIEDPQLGTLTKSGGKWKGRISFGPHRDVALRLSGGKEPDAAALELARDLPARYEALRPQIARELFEHAEPYLEDLSPPIRLTTPEDVWPHVQAEFVRVEPLRGSPAPGPILEIAFTTAWDEEHTVAARIQDWRVFELCGSV